MRSRARVRVTANQCKQTEGLLTKRDEVEEEEEEGEGEEAEHEEEGEGEDEEEGEEKVGEERRVCVRMRVARGTRLQGIEREKKRDQREGLGGDEPSGQDEPKRSQKSKEEKDVAQGIREGETARGKNYRGTESWLFRCMQRIPVDT